MYSQHVKKKSKPKQKTDSSRQKYSKITMNRIKQDLSEEIKRYISSFEKKNGIKVKLTNTKQV